MRKNEVSPDTGFVKVREPSFALAVFVTRGTQVSLGLYSGEPLARFGMSFHLDVCFG
jgi:hypothetical protein